MNSRGAGLSEGRTTASAASAACAIIPVVLATSAAAARTIVGKSVSAVASDQAAPVACAAPIGKLGIPSTKALSTSPACNQNAVDAAARRNAHIGGACPARRKRAEEDMTAVAAAVETADLSVALAADVDP